MAENRQEREIIRSSRDVSIVIPDNDTDNLVEEEDIKEDKDSALADAILKNAGMALSLGVICEVPNNLDTPNRNRYEPTTAAIGPYHRKKEHQHVTEALKTSYLAALLSRPRQEQTSLEHIIKAMREKEYEFKSSYGHHKEKIKLLTSDECVKMMILDGCFILELIYKFKEYKVGAMEEGYKTMDPIFSYTWMLRHLQRDLILLENQLPFSVLKDLFDLTSDPKHNESLSDLVVNFLDPEIQTYGIPRNDELTGKHLLDLVRNHLLGKSPQKNYGKYPNWKLTRYCAADLKNAGVVFKKNENAKSLLDITFNDQDGNLIIPPFFFGEGMIVYLQNLIALEQSSSNYTSHITSYVIFLDTLIKSKEDVKLLRSEGIINGSLNEEKKMARTINGLYSRAIVDSFYYDELYQRVNAFCEQDKQKRRVLVRQWSIEFFDNFSTPWRAISVSLGLAVTLLTLTLTIISLISTFKKRTHAPMGYSVLSQVF
ncbi:hypothetical protein IFM89_025004 [Coptis chinensis]|uniref:Uncharacterized protein n=1 Tax=Coptis chinensis TaxID=261450 RepID=A0A835HX78_9MAGN|nr:hypothetical protein IFM89_025004 [Coptis chinensis]